MRNCDTFFEKLYKEKYTTLYHYVHRMILDYELAEDVVQETFYAAYRKRELLMEHESPVGWLYLTAKNKIMKARKMGTKFTSLETIGVEKSEIDNNYEKKDLEGSLEIMLTKEEIELLYKYYEYGYSSKEIANELGISESCFRTRMFRMREKIKKLL